MTIEKFEEMIMGLVKKLLQVIVCFTVVNMQGAEIQILKEEIIKSFNSSFLTSLSNDTQKLAFLGCLNLAKKKQQEFVLELNKLEEQKFKQLTNEKGIDRESQKKLIREIIELKMVKSHEIEYKIEAAIKEINIQKSIAQQIFKRTLEDTTDKKDGVKNCCKMIGTISDEQRSTKENSLTFYLPETLDSNSSILVLAFVVKQMLNEKQIAAKVFISFVSGSNDTVVEVIVQRDSKRIILEKNTDLSIMIENIMVNFLPIVSKT